MNTEVLIHYEDDDGIHRYTLSQITCQRNVTVVKINRGINGGC